MRICWLLILCCLSPLSAADYNDIYGYPIGEQHYYGGKNPDRSQFVGINGNGRKNVSLRSDVFAQFIALKQKAATSGVHLSVVSGYRTVSEQSSLQKKYPKLAEKAGYSEHHLGTAIDLFRVGHRSRSFLWLLENAIDAGWVPTYYYRSNSTFRQEPWHWRYVGKSAAQTFKANWRKSISRDIRRLQKRKPNSTVSKASGTVIVNTRCERCLKLRAGPSTEHEILSTLAQGQRLTILGNTNSWYKVDAAGQVGYVHAAYVR